MSDAQKKKTVTLNIELPPATGAPFYFANRLHITEEQDAFFIYFGSGSSLRLETDDLGMFVSKMDFENQKSEMERYFAQIGESVTRPPLEPWRPVNVKYLQAANLMQLARRDLMADTTFYVFSLHDTIVRPGPKNDSPPPGFTKDGKKIIPGRPVLTIRSSVSLQLTMLAQLLKI